MGNGGIKMNLSSYNNYFKSSVEFYLELGNFKLLTTNVPWKMKIINYYENYCILDLTNSCIFTKNLHCDLKEP